MSDTRKISLASVQEFLTRKGWQPKPQVGRMQAYVAPSDLGLPADYLLYVPRSESSVGGEESVGRIVDVIADLYATSSAQLRDQLSAQESILSIRLQGLDFARGSVPFVSFEAVIEKLKRALLHAASFVVSSTPTIDRVPDEATEYLARCRFLQTGRGSFVARVQLPDSSPLVEASLFDAEVGSAEVGTTLLEALSFISSRVLNNDPAVNSDESFEDNVGVINIDLFKDISELFERSGASEIDFTLATPEREQRVSSGSLSTERLEKLSAFVKFARERLRADREIDINGRIVELRSRQQDRRRNHVVISAILDGEAVFIALQMSKNDYPYAVTAHKNNSLVRLRASVRKLKTQLRVIKLGSFEELVPPEAPAGDR